MPLPTKHKPSGCTLPLPMYIQRNSSLTPSVPEPAFKQRKTLAEQGGEPISRRLPAPKVASSVKTTAPRGLAASTSRALSKPTARHPAAATLHSSVGVAPKASGNVRPKSAYGLGSHGRSKSYHQAPRPATAMLNRDDDDDDSEQSERKGVQPFLISTNPSTRLRVPKGVSLDTKKRMTSLSISRQKLARILDARVVSSPSSFRPITPVIEEPSDTDCDEICTRVGALTVGALKADVCGSRSVGYVMPSDYGTNPFLKPKLPRYLLHHPSPSPVRPQQVDPSPYRPQSTTPRRQPPAPFLNRFTNDRCPDFYNERMEAMERDFRMFKEKMETDVRQATDYKESISQLQSRGMCFLFHSSSPSGRELC